MTATTSTTPSAHSAESTSRTLDGPEPLHVHEAGAGEALVLLHGSGPGVSAWSNFGSNFPFFADRYRTLAPDLPGFGASYVPNLDRPYHRIAADAVARMLDALGIERAHILGNSAGGSVAGRFAVDHADRVDRLVLMGPGGVGTPVLSPSPSEGIRRLLEFVADPTRDRLVAWLDTMVVDRSILTDELVEERLANALAPGALAWMRSFFSHISGRGPSRPVDPVPLWAEVSKITAPTLITWGRDDRVTPLENALLPLRQMKDVELHVFANCGHWAMIERRGEFQRVVHEFLTRA
jgi:4,5:9,10-diseco-3-hydroxy-5,9,17-trioxoandrosta-1(10),2-diene-4-oate hydrolase